MIDRRKRTCRRVVVAWIAVLNSLLLLLGAAYGLPVLPALLSGEHSLSIVLQAGHWRVILGHEAHSAEEVAPASSARGVARVTSGAEWQQDGDHQLLLADHQPIPMRAGRARSTAALAHTDPPVPLGPCDALATIARWRAPRLPTPRLRELSTIVLLI